MFWDEVRFTIHCDASWYILVPQGQQPWGHVRELTRVDRVEARDLLIEAVSACWDAPNWPLLDLFDIEGHPSNVPQQELREAVEAKLSGFDAPDLYREVLGNRSFEAAAVAPAPPARREAPAVAKPRSFIIIEVVSSTGAAVPGAYLELTTPDGAVRTLVTDAYGRAAAHDIDDGVCGILLPKLDRSSWTADGSKGQLVSSNPGSPHVVAPGECLSQLAHAHGIAKWQTLWDHPDNAPLKAKRKSAHVLLPGDRVFIPGLELAKIERATDAIHRITVTNEAADVELVLVLRDHEGSALQGEPYELAYRHVGKLEKRTGELSASGELRELFPASVRSADLRLIALDVRRRLAIGHLDPTLDEQSQPLATGVRTRLSALGFAARKSGSGPHADLRAAVRLFQHQVMGMSDPTGVLDEATCAKLEEAYGV